MDLLHPQKPYHPRFFARANKKPSGFTLLEILIAIFIFAIVMTTLFSSHNLVLNNAAAIDEGISGYEMAKTCLDRMILDLQSVYLNLPPEYTPPGFDAPPEPYRIVGDGINIGNISFSRLRFTSMAHVSFGNSIENGIAELIYYVRETDENNYVLRRADSLYPYKPFEENSNDPILCENLRLLTFKYYDRDGTEYDVWDSESSDFKYATPVAVGIKLEIGNDSTHQSFETMVTLPIHREKIE